METNKTGWMPSLRQVDLITIWLGVFLLVLVSWQYLFSMAQMMESMPDMYADKGAWQPLDFWSMFLMWAIMMIAMMVPTAVRTLMIFARIAKAQSTSVISTTYLFLAGYITVWSLFSIAATLMQWQLDQATLLSPMMVSTSHTLGAALLILAGAYQLSPLKEACLRHCQSPVGFISEHFRPGYRGAFTMGLQHGAFCLGCCWLLMLLLFLAGVMNLLWILLITLFVLCEKLLPTLLPVRRKIINRMTSAALIVSGLSFLFRFL